MEDLTGAGTQAAGLGTRGARYTLVVVWALGIWSTLLQGTLSDYAPQMLLASSLQMVGLLLLTLPGGNRLPPTHAVLCTATLLLAGGVALYTAPPDGELWPFSFATYLLALLTTRGNVVEGAGGGIVLILAGFVFGATNGVAASELFAFLALPAVAFIIGIIWRFTLFIAVKRERVHLGEAELARIAAEAAEASSAREQAMINEVRAEAAPVLDAIRLGHTIGDAEALRISALEAGIRDRIRSPRLRHPLLDDTIKAARERGVHVVLLGSGSTGDARIGDLPAKTLAEAIARTVEGSVTIRAVPPGQRAAVSMLVSGTEGTVRSLVGRDGELLDHR